MCFKLFKLVNLTLFVERYSQHCYIITDGYSYFGISGSDVKLVNRLDVEYGLITWTVKVLAIDNAGPPETGKPIFRFKIYIV